MFFTKKDTITSMCDGTWKPACELSDPAFAQQLIGPTLAISPLSQDAPITICAPFDAQVTTVFPRITLLVLRQKLALNTFCIWVLTPLSLRAKALSRLFLPVRAFAQVSPLCAWIPSLFVSVATLPTCCLLQPTANLTPLCARLNRLSASRWAKPLRSVPSSRACTCTNG